MGYENIRQVYNFLGDLITETTVELASAEVLRLERKNHGSAHVAMPVGSSYEDIQAAIELREVKLKKNFEAKWARKRTAMEAKYAASDAISAKIQALLDASTTGTVNSYELLKLIDERRAIEAR